MDCEMCGKQATAKARIEGVDMAVCANCAKHGSNVRSLPSAAPKAKAGIAFNRPLPKDEIIETVRPDVAKVLRQHREKLKMNQEQFAAKLQIRASTYNHWESGAVAPPMETARKIEHVLGVPLVVHMKVQAGAAEKRDEEARGLQLGDFIKKRK
jgi:uncharacterized protein (TIGR00270 family)